MFKVVSRIFLSGFYVDDIPVIQQSLTANGLTFVEQHENNRWAMVVAEKS